MGIHFPTNGARTPFKIVYLSFLPTESVSTNRSVQTISSEHPTMLVFIYRFHKSRSSSGRKSDHARLIWCNSTEDLPPPASRRSSLLNVINFSAVFCREERWILMHPDAFCREERFDSMLSTFFIEVNTMVSGPPMSLNSCSFYCCFTVVIYVVFRACAM